MNIGFDAKRAFHNLAGLGHYSRLLINSLTSNFPSHGYHLFTPSVTPHFSTPPNQDNVQINKPPFLTQLFFSKAWRAKGIVNDLKKTRIDLYHGLSNELPVSISDSGIKSVVTIHDLIFKRFPDYYFAWDRPIYESKTKRACAEADHIIAISEQTKTDLIEFYHIPSRKISVIPPPINSLFFQEATTQQIDEVSRSLNLPEHFMLYVGTIEERKNLLGLVKAMNELKDRKDLHLVVIGKPLMYKQRVVKYIQEQNLGAYIHFLEGITDVQLRMIYSMANVFVYPSFYEGFGMPVTEAQASKVPVIASDIPVLKEAGGEAAIYVNPSEPSSIAQAIEDVLSNETRRTLMIKQGSENASNFREEIIAKKVMDIYSAVTAT